MSILTLWSKLNRSIFSKKVLVREGQGAGEVMQKKQGEKEEKLPLNPERLEPS